MKTPLSSRIRPNCEAAPWVVAEVRELELRLQAAYDELNKIRSAMKAVFDRDVCDAAKNSGETQVNTEQEIQAKGLTAPRVTPADVEENISAEFYFTATEGVEGAAKNHGGYRDTHCVRHDDNPALIHTDLLTFCVLVMRNGCTVTGESACASPENFDAELGRKIARQKAVDKIWPLLGYALKSQLHERNS